VSPRTAAVLAVLGGVALAVAAVVAAHVSGFVLAWAVAVPAGLAAGLLTAVGILTARVDAPDLEPPPPERTAPVSPMADLSSLHYMLQDGARDPRRFEFRVRPRLRAVAVERLWQRHGVDWQHGADQASVRSIVGPRTWDLLTAPPHALPVSPDDLTRLLDELETL
jgi:hypothetical protein